MYCTNLELVSKLRFVSHYCGKSEKQTVINSFLFFSLMASPKKKKKKKVFRKKPYKKPGASGPPPEIVRVRLPRGWEDR